jgi:hypothetical protein
VQDAKITRSDTRDAERIRTALIQAALDGYERAALSGLCAEGAWEAAIAAMRRLDLDAVGGRDPDPAPGRKESS